MDASRQNFYLIISVCLLVTTFLGCDLFKSSKEQAAAPKGSSPTLAAAPATPPQSTKQESQGLSPSTLARVGKWSITIDQFNDRLQALKEVIPEYDINDPEAKRLVLDELIRQQLLVEEAERTGLADGEDIVAAVEEFRRTLLVRELAGKLTEGIEVSDEEIQAFYDENKEVLITPIDWRVSELVVKDQVKANEILIEILKGGDFADLAKKNSISASAEKGGDLGFLTEEPFPEMVNALLPLEQGDVSSVFKGPEGYYLVKVAEKKGGDPIPLEEIKEEIRQNQLLVKQQQAILDYLAQLGKNIEVQVQEELLQTN